jgi:hypothetical protein
MLGQSGCFTQLEPVIRRSFDLASMARLSVGPSWANLTDAQRQQVTDSFGRYISAIYADRFDSYAGQRLEVTGEQPVAAGIMVKSRIVRPAATRSKSTTGCAGPAKSGCSPISISTARSARWRPAAPN